MDWRQCMNDLTFAMNKAGLRIIRVDYVRLYIETNKAVIYLLRNGSELTGLRCDECFGFGNMSRRYLLGPDKNTEELEDLLTYLKQIHKKG